MNNLLKSVLGSQLGKTPAQRGFTSGQPVHLLAKVSEDAVIAVTASPSDEGTSGVSSPRCKLHDHDHSCTEKLKKVVVCSPATYGQFKTLSYLHHFVTADDIAGTLRDWVISGF